MAENFILSEDEGIPIPEETLGGFILEELQPDEDVRAIVPMRTSSMQ
jgi:hypothetical protein